MGDKMGNDAFKDDNKVRSLTQSERGSHCKFAF